MKVYLKQVLDWLPEGTWVQVRCAGLDNVFFGRTGRQGTDELVSLVKERYSPHPEVYQMTHLEGFDQGLAIKVK